MGDNKTTRDSGESFRSWRQSRACTCLDLQRGTKNNPTGPTGSQFITGCVVTFHALRKTSTSQTFYSGTTFRRAENNLSRLSMLPTPMSTTTAHPRHIFTSQFPYPSWNESSSAVCNENPHPNVVSKHRQSTGLSHHNIMRGVLGFKTTIHV